MPVKLNEGLETFQAKRQEFINLVQNNAPQVEQDAAYSELLNAMAQDVKNAAIAEAREEAHQIIENQERNKGMSQNEIKFFNDINKEVGYKEEKLLPEETIDEIFEDMVRQHPLLQALGIKNNGLRMKFLRSETSGVAVWGDIFGEIKGQLDAAFSEDTAIQHKLTAFVVLPKDLEEFGPKWIKRFVSLQIQEAFAVALEAAFLKGDGVSKPVGLTRKVAKGTSVIDGMYPEKAATGTLTFANAETAKNEMAGVFKHLSTKENGEPVAVAGKVLLIINPQDEWDIKAAYTHLNDAGVYITAFPFNPTFVTSEAMTAKKAIACVVDRYDAIVAGGVSVKQYDQTLALEDMNLYTAKQFAFGKAKDDKAAALYNLNVTSLPTA
ncbi:phage major capsid protein [Listeria ilorinensis]|uniref:phage major capsid protein n=1 Tax=Listeria ilorinensis TaxID=2867439 RepID=UPI001EF46632|nr:phage major capsid protein [Listeria ilorinensis]